MSAPSPEAVAEARRLAASLEVWAGELERLARWALDGTSRDRGLPERTMARAADLRTAARLLDALEAAEAERDEAVRWIGVVRDELVMAGGKGGDRTVALANLRALIREREAFAAAASWLAPRARAAAARLPEGDREGGARG